MSLEKWFKIKNKKPKDNFNPFILKYFYLQWTSNKEYSIEWTNEKPKVYTYEKSVNLKNYGKIIFIGNINYNKDNYSLIKDSKNYYCKNNQFLKSHLQKCIRRGKNFKAICTTYQLLENNPTDFLRRLPIIIIEDVHIIKDIDIIIWFMVMSPFIKLPESFKKWLLYLVNFISLYPRKNYYSKIDKPNINKINDVPIKFRSTLYSLLIRIQFGGMKGDIKMMNFLVDSWINRLINGDKLLILRPRNVIIKKTLEPENYQISGLDFHCCRKIIDIIQKIHTNFDKNLIKKTIWLKSSSINFRDKKYIEEIDVELCWDKIKHDLHRIQKKFIKKYIYSI